MGERQSALQRAIGPCGKIGCHEQLFHDFDLHSLQRVSRANSNYCTGLSFVALTLIKAARMDDCTVDAQLGLD
jgi:hypothetical protein